MQRALLIGRRRTAQRVERGQPHQRNQRLPVTLFAIRIDRPEAQRTESRSAQILARIERRQHGLRILHSQRSVADTQHHVYGLIVGRHFNHFVVRKRRRHLRLQ